MLGVGSIRCFFFVTEIYKVASGLYRQRAMQATSVNKKKKTSTLSIGHRLDLVQMLGVTRVISSQIITQSLITIFLFQNIFLE